MCQNLSMGLCGKLAKSISWSTSATVTYPVDKVVRSLNNNLQVLSVKPGLVLIGLPTTLSCRVGEQNETEEHLSTTCLIVYSCSAYFSFYNHVGPRF